jgi:CRISPR-associated protein Csb2
MIALSIEFLAGRFHTTPWNSSSRKENLEWPPSPWRLLRAIVTGWLAESEDIEILQRVLDRLASPPRFLLPPWIIKPARQPTSREETAPFVLDTFVAFSRKTTAYVVWDDTSFSHAEFRALQKACSQIGHLGFPESWCAVTALSELEDLDPDLILVDLSSRSITPGVPVRRIGPSADMRGIGLLHSLLLPIMEISGRRQPAGSTWLDYTIPYQAADIAADARPETLLPANVERFALEGPTKKLQPPVTDALIVAESMRSAAMKAYSNIFDGEEAPGILSGKAPDGNPGFAHKHAYFLPRDLDDDGKIDHIDVYLPHAYSHRTHRALLSVRQLYSRQLPLARNQRYAITNIGQATPECARTWTSITPFVLDRHPHRRIVDGAHIYRDTPEEQIRRSLTHHQFPADVAIEISREPIEHQHGTRTRLDMFRRVRKNDNPLPVFGARLTFAEPQIGPIALGRYAHFGLGQFAPYE